MTLACFWSCTDVGGFAEALQGELGGQGSDVATAQGGGDEAMQEESSGGQGSSVDSGGAEGSSVATAQGGGDLEEKGDKEGDSVADKKTSPAPTPDKS